MSSTRERILDAAMELVDAAPATVPSMSEVARATGISRQALYLHFPDRAALLLALVGHVDARTDLAGEIAKVAAAGDGAAQVRAWVAMQARRNPRIASLARALDQTRHEDDSTTVAWRDRTDNRMRAATAIVRQLRREGGVHRSWTTAEAATVLWELASFRVWDDVVNEAGMAPDRYVEIVTTAALATLAASVRRGPRRAAGQTPRSGTPCP
jgi:AcrR family transcriptional regulator